jgi:hypothetical protein
MTTAVTKESLVARIAELESGARSLKEDYTLAAYKMLLATMEVPPVAEVIQKLNGYDRPLYVVAIEGEIEEGDVLYRHAQPAPAVSDDIGGIRVGRLPTMNQDDYPGLGDWWVQLRIGEDFDEVLARVYGATPQEANNRAEALARRAAMLNQK